MNLSLEQSFLPAQQAAQNLVQSWNKHLKNDGLIILLGSAHKSPARLFLELRQSLIETFKNDKKNCYQILLPCLGEQQCGAFAAPEDWCHEKVAWWRPPYFKKVDQLARLDRKEIAMSYLVISKSKRPKQELLPILSQSNFENNFRVVSPVHKKGQDFVFYLCGQQGKYKTQFRQEGATIDQGSIFIEADFDQGEMLSRVHKLKKMG